MKHQLSMQCIFQDPFSSLNPRMTAGENITYGLKIHKLIDANKAKSLAEDLMEINEKKLVNKTIDKKSLIRQKEIQTRLLEHEKAQRSQKQDDKRQSEVPPQTIIKIPKELEKKVQERKNQKELLRKTSPQMGDYYKQKTDLYLQQIR